MIKTPPPGTDLVALEARYSLERRLADRLRRAGAEEREGLYAEVYGEYARQTGATTEDDPASVALQLQVLEPWLEGATHLVEIGAGSGSVARAVAERVEQVIAIEAVLPEDADRAAARGLRWVSHQQADAQIAPTSMDVAYSCHVLEHLHADDLGLHLETVHRWLRAGGVYVMVTPNRLHGPHDISGYFDARPTGFHLREYTHTELARAVDRAGFERVQPLDPSGSPRSRLGVQLAEAVLDLAGQRARHWLFERTRLASRAPLRPLEQVVLVAHR